MCIKHRVYCPKWLVYIKNGVQRTFSRNKDRFTAIEGFINITHNATGTIAGYLSSTKLFVVFSITDGHDVGQHSIFAFAAKFRKNGLRRLL